MSDVYSARDLWEQPKIFSGLQPPAKLAVFGNPVQHSLSPGFQTAALKTCGLQAQYVRIQASAEELERGLRALGPAGFWGANITIPHKPAALQIVDEAEETARRAGGVNTILVEDGRLLGFSTDGPGLVRAIHEDFFVDLKDLRVMLLGAGGGAGRAAAVQCAIEGCERLVLVNRTLSKALALAEELAPHFRSERLVGPSERLVAIPADLQALEREIEHVDIVINATPLGMKRTDPSPLPAQLLTPNLLVYDMVYARGGTRLVAEAKAAGARAAGGLSMLLHQGALSFEIWFNRPAPLQVMREALLRDAGVR